MISQAGGRIGLLLFLFLIVWGIPSAGAETIRVLAVPEADEGKASSEGTIQVLWGNREIASVPPGAPLRLIPTSKGIQVNGVRHKTDRLTLRASGPVKFNKILLKGEEALVYRKGSSLAVVDILDLEEYLRGVLGQEMPPDWEIEALKAQAVAARTYALHQRINRKESPYDVGTTTDDQVYSSRTPKPQVRRAVDETRGLILTSGDRPILAVYHSSCGGRTETGRDLWGYDLPYLRSIDCPYDIQSPYHQWKREIPVDQIERALREAGYPIGTIATLTPYRKNRSGRVEKMRILHSDGVLVIKGGDFRKAIGYEILPSASFEVDSLGSRIGFSGRGRGHGVGLCQWGAKGMAEEGHDFREILNFYYPGVEIKVLES